MSYELIAPGFGHAPGLVPLDTTTAPMLQHTEGRDRITNLADAMRSDIPRSERREMAEGCLDAPHIIPAGGMTRYLDCDGRFEPRFSWRHQVDCGAMARIVEIEHISARRRDGSRAGSMLGSSGQRTPRSTARGRSPTSPAGPEQGATL